MGVLYDYFRAPDVAGVRAHMNGNAGFSPVPVIFRGFDLKGIDPGVMLGKLVGLVAGEQWRPGLVGERLVWPEGAEQDMEYEGPWVSVLGDEARDVLAGIPADQVPELTDRWAAIEEFDGDADPEFLHEVIVELTALATQARANGESLYCWMSL